MKPYVATASRPGSRSNRHSGFTLIELLVVTAALAILPGPRPPLLSPS